MAKSKEEKEALKAAKAAAKASAKETGGHSEYTMTTKGGKKLKVMAPDNSIDKDAESALGGVYRIG